MREWLPAFLITANFVFASWAYRRLPELSMPRWDLWIPWSLPSTVEPLPRMVAALGLPMVGMAIWVLLTVIASPFGERLGRRVFPTWLVSERTGAKGVERFSPTFDSIVVAIVTSIFLVHIGAVATILEWPTWTVRACLAGVGLVVIGVGNVMPRTRPNWIAGLRTKHAMRDPDLWRTTHRRFGALLMLTGGSVVAVAIFATPYALLTGIVGGLVSAVVATSSVQNDNQSGTDGRSSTPAVVMLLALVGWIKGITDSF